MLNLIKRYLAPIIVSRVKAGARHLATSTGVLLLGWLIQHHVGGDLAVRMVGDYKDLIEVIVEAVCGMALAAYGVGGSQRDVTHVDAKLTATAAAGVSAGVELAHARQDGAEQQATADQALADAVKQAIATGVKATPADKAAIVASLKAGSF